MPSPFAELQRELNAACDAEFGERVRVLPRIQSDYLVGAADPSREPYEVVAKVDVAPVEVQSIGGRRGDGDRLNVQATSQIVSFAMQVFSPPGGPSREPPKKGDGLQLLDQPGAPERSISVADLDGQGRWICYLS